MNGPEYSRGWRERVKLGETEFLIEAAHRYRRRFPRGHEIVRTMARGKPLAMVEEVVAHEWQVSVGHRRVGTVRGLPNGRFEIASTTKVFDRLRDAAAALAIPPAAPLPLGA
jgi:hypothetical protein